MDRYNVNKADKFICTKNGFINMIKQQAAHLA